MRYLLFLIVFVLFACSEEETILQLSTENITLNYQGEKQQISLNANKEVSALSMDAWVESSLDNSSRAYVLNIWADANPSEIERQTAIVITSSEKNDTVVVKQEAKPFLRFSGDHEITIDENVHSNTIYVLGNVKYDIKLEPNDGPWIVAKKDGYKIDISYTINDLVSVRSCKLVISNKEYSISDTLVITQYLNSKGHQDGSYQLIHKATKGDVNLVIMGDGFIKQDLSVDGIYEKTAQQACGYFFSIEPFVSFKDYFNVYVVYAESDTRDVEKNNKMGLNKVQTKFNSTFGNGTEINCDYEMVYKYRDCIKELPSDKPSSVILFINCDRYAGTTVLSQDGNSIAMCPMSTKESPNDFEGLIHHEAGGHGFGFLCDEYIYNKSSITNKRIEDIRSWQALGYQKNLDFTNDPKTVLWNDLIGLDGYDEVGCYEGGDEYQYGVWRSEENSCMNNNVPYFNIQSRRIIVNRIMELSGKAYTLNEFLQYDRQIPKYHNTRSITQQHIPLAPPIWISSKK